MKTSAKITHISNRISKVTALIIIGALATGCSDAKQKNYVVPKSLCGTPVPSALLDRVLPASGDKVSTHSDGRAKGVELCRIAVDGTYALSASIEWHEKGTTVEGVAAGQIGVNLAEHVSEDGSYGYGEKGAVAHAECPNPGTEWRKENGDLFVTIFITNKGTPDEAAMKELIRAYSKAAQKSEVCTGNS